MPRRMLPGMSEEENKTMKVILCGYCGHMGQEVRASAERMADVEIALGVDPNMPEGTEGCVRSFSECDTAADVLVDFSHHSMTKALTDFARRRKLPLVLATTGQTEEEKQLIRETAEEIPLFLAANYSLGIATLTDLIQRALMVYPEAEVEIVEAHHDRKLDAPSGTALALFDAVRQVRPEAVAHPGRSGQGKRTPEEVGIASLRMGNVVGMHEVMIVTRTETLTLKHEAASRGVFADGALKAAIFLAGKKPGLYDMKDLLRAEE